MARTFLVFFKVSIKFAVLDKFQGPECQSVAMSIWDKNEHILSFMKQFQIIRNV